MLAKILKNTHNDREVITMDENAYKKVKQPTSIKFDKELLERIKADAERDRRSITGQIEYMLYQYYEIKKKLN